MQKFLFSLTFILGSFIQAECSDLSYNECIYWGSYCEWNEDSGQCQEIGGGGGGGEADGPYDYQIITESDGLRNGPLYIDGRLYYPIDAEPPFKSIIFTPGFGGESIYRTSDNGFIISTVGGVIIKTDPDLNF